MKKILQVNIFRKFFLECLDWPQCFRKCKYKPTTTNHRKPNHHSHHLPPKSQIEEKKSTKASQPLQRTLPPLPTNPPSHPPQPPSHPRNPDREGTKNPLTLNDSRSEILVVAFVDFKTRSKQRATKRQW